MQRFALPLAQLAPAILVSAVQSSAISSCGASIYNCPAMHQREEADTRRQAGTQLNAAISFALMTCHQNAILQVRSPTCIACIYHWQHYSLLWL